MNPVYANSRRRFLKVLSGGCAVLLARGSGSVLASNAEATRPAARELAEHYGPVTRYRITRKGNRIGTHEVRFSGSGEQLRVSVESTIRVTVLKVPVFTFNYVGEETWEDNQLKSAVATTIENRIVSKVSMSNSASASRLLGPDGTLTVERLSFASNHWNVNVTGSHRIFNTITGRANVIDMQDMGAEEIITGRGAVQATHYRISGEIEADVWYDQNLRWSQLAFNGKDGSRIDYIIE